jgi:hypothetical protein
MQVAKDAVNLFRRNGAVFSNSLASQRYASGAISVAPNPPLVGVPARITLRLKNLSMEPLMVSRVETQVARFGMGLTWKELPALGPIHLPADPRHVEEVTIHWIPTACGHRCVHSSIFLENAAEPVLVGCNLHVIESESERAHWVVPFRVGNPEDVRMPVALVLNGDDPAVGARILVQNRELRAGELLWLETHEERDALLLLQAPGDAALSSTVNVEAMLGVRFLDGIQVILHRPARPVQTKRQTAHAFDEAITAEFPVPMLQAPPTEVFRQR